MELDLTGQLEWRAEAPVASDSPAAMKESGVVVNLDLSLGWSSGEVGSRKRVWKNDEAVEGKKPKMEEGLLPYRLQVMPVILQRPNGHCYACMVPCWLPCSVYVFENGVYKPGGNRNLAVEMDGVATVDGRMEVVGGGGLSSPESCISGTAVRQSFPSKGDDIITNESRSHSNNATKDNSLHISSFRNSNSGLKKPLDHTKGRKKPALNQMHKPLVFTRSVEGKKTDGYLYQYSKDEVIIICSCHGSVFSPAGFVRHAGGLETQNPLRQITVIPS